MMEVDVVAIGSGPAGREAALAAVEAGASAMVVEQDREVGGGCVRFGTIPSKTLRETAVVLRSLGRKTAGVFKTGASRDHELAALTRRLGEVVDAHDRAMRAELEGAGVAVVQGRARLRGRDEVEIQPVRGEPKRVRARRAIVLATGSRPRTPDHVPVDHESVLDSDSILSLTYLPESLIVLGGGVIASEYASIFAALGVHVAMLDKGPRPLGFLDPELTQRFERALQAMGGSFVPGSAVARVEPSGLGAVRVTLADGGVLEAEKVLCALGRVANVELLDLGAAGLALSARGHVPVGPHGETAVPGIYAVGDVAGPPALATSAADQGRRAARHALGLGDEPGAWVVPTGVYTIPELACVGLDEASAREKHGTVLVGRAPFAQTARGMIAGNEEGFLKLVASPDGERVLGVAAVGEGASELVSVGQVAMLAGFPVDRFVRSVFNFPTMMEAYRLAAVDIRRQRERGAQPAAAAE